LIAEHLGAKRIDGATAQSLMMPDPASTEEVNLEALSDAEIEGLLGDETDPDVSAEPQNAMR
jgi:hypothetical protein